MLLPKRQTAIFFSLHNPSSCTSLPFSAFPFRVLLGISLLWLKQVTEQELHCSHVVSSSSTDIKMLFYLNSFIFRFYCFNRYYTKCKILPTWTIRINSVTFNSGCNRFCGTDFWVHNLIICTILAWLLSFAHYLHWSHVTFSTVDGTLWRVQIDFQLSFNWRRYFSFIFCLYNSNTRIYFRVME